MLKKTNEIKIEHSKNWNKTQVIYSFMIGDKLNFKLIKIKGEDVFRYRTPNDYVRAKTFETIFNIEKLDTHNFFNEFIEKYQAIETIKNSYDTVNAYEQTRDAISGVAENIQNSLQSNNDENCKYCEMPPYESCFINMLEEEHKPLTATFVENGKLFTTQIIDGYYEEGHSYCTTAKINFCPMCGKQLSKEED